MKFINMPTHTVQVNDYARLYAACTAEEDDWHISLTTSDKNALVVWLRKNHPDMKLITRQLGAKYELHHSAPKPYVIRFVPRNKE